MDSTAANTSQTPQVTHQTLYEYDGLGRLVRQWQRPDTAQPLQQVRFVHGPSGQIIQETNLASGVVSEYFHGPDGQLIARHDQTATGPPDGLRLWRPRGQRGGGGRRAGHGAGRVRVLADRPVAGLCAGSGGGGVELEPAVAGPADRP